MQYFVRVRERHDDGVRKVYPDLMCSGLSQAVKEAKRMVLEADQARMLEADACFRKGTGVHTKYRCWMDARGSLHESALI